jgi:mannose-6-phosphate isomerase-like protein (cupin superfamily)
VKPSTQADARRPTRCTGSALRRTDGAVLPFRGKEDAMKDEHFESVLRRDGFVEVERRNMPPGMIVAEHAHPFDVRALVLNGEITLTVDGVEYSYREGDIFVLPAGHRHAEAVGPAGVDYLVGRRRAAVTPTNDPSRTS